MLIVAGFPVIHGYERLFRVLYYFLYSSRCNDAEDCLVFHTVMLLFTIAPVAARTCTDNVPSGFGRRLPVCKLADMRRLLYSYVKKSK
jgi:hypothetical protein